MDILTNASIRHLSMWIYMALNSRKKALCRLSSAKGVSNAVPPLFTACAASWLLTKSYPVTGITRENLRPEYPVSALRLGSYLPHSCLEAAFQRIHAAALSGKGKCVLLFVIAFWIWLITNKKYSTGSNPLSRKSCFPTDCMINVQNWHGKKNIFWLF